ncbi:hypothetical protein [Caldalkalibacillus salinus]|uniref:hypothetical protein n=1 Tax=Caldalkalibacillus salinus TaxID=2803787 RepID=UPI001924BEC9|nr:hypothetical protein [Caldalkalibacillus salinus]
MYVIRALFIASIIIGVLFIFTGFFINKKKLEKLDYKDETLWRKYPNKALVGSIVMGLHRFLPFWSVRVLFILIGLGIILLMFYLHPSHF